MSWERNECAEKSKNKHLKTSTRVTPSKPLYKGSHSTIFSKNANYAPPSAIEMTRPERT